MKIEIVHSDIPLPAAVLADETVQGELTRSITDTKAFTLSQLNFTETADSVLDDEETALSDAEVAEIRLGIIAEVEAKYYVRYAADRDTRKRNMYFYSLELYAVYMKYHRYGLRY